MALNQEDINFHLERRKPGQSSITTSRSEKDRVKILSGLQKGISLGTPICMMVQNEDVKKSDYSDFRSIPRPGHADYTYLLKYGNKAESGGGRSSARQTVARVCAGALAQKMIKEKYGISIVSFVYSVGNIAIPDEIKENFIKNPPSFKEVDTIGTYISY